MHLLLVSLISPKGKGIWVPRDVTVMWERKIMSPL